MAASDSTEHAPGLPLDVADALAAALVCSVGEQLQARLLIVKGFVTSHYGLRSPRISADVDVLVRPGDLDGVMSALRSAGWRDRPRTAGAALLAAHSQELIHDDWPCDIDVHHRFPGLLAEPDAAFDALWQQRSALPVAGYLCPIPDRAGAIIVTALHALRHADTEANHTEELASLAGTLAALTGAERVSLTELATACGADGPLQDLFAAHGIEMTVADSAALVDWTTRRLAGDAYAGNVVASIGRAPWKDRPRLAWLAFWPSAADMRAIHPEIAAGGQSLFAARMARLGRGMAQLPRAFAARRAARKGNARP